MPRKATFGHFHVQIGEKNRKEKARIAYISEPIGRWFEGVRTAQHARQAKGAHSLVSCPHRASEARRTCVCPSRVSFCFTIGLEITESSAELHQASSALPSTVSGFVLGDKKNCSGVVGPEL
jgi:hypothetical protein